MSNDEIMPETMDVFDEAFEMDPSLGAGEDAPADLPTAEGQEVEF